MLSAWLKFLAGSDIPSRKRSGVKRFRPELGVLEDRILPTLLPANVVAEFAGTIALANETCQIPLELTPADFSLAATGKVRLSFLVQASGGSAIDPAAVEIRHANGTEVKPSYFSDDLSDPSGSLVVASLPHGRYTVTVTAEEGTSGAFSLDVFLAGDANGTRSVGTRDVRAVTRMRQGRDLYDVAADVNLNNVIDPYDVQQARRNVGASTRITPLNLSFLDLSPAAVLTDDGSLVTSAEQITIRYTSNPWSIVSLDTNSDGRFDQGTQADASGIVTFTVMLQQGNNRLLSANQDGFGQRRTVSLSITRASQAPAAPDAPKLALLDDTGISHTDGVTAVAMPFIEGTVEPLAEIQVLVDGVVKGAGRADSTGIYRIALAESLAEGQHTVQVRQRDGVGAVSLLSAPLMLFLDTQPPESPSALDLIPQSDRGHSDSDNITNLPELTFELTATVGCTVELLKGETVLDVTTPDANGRCRFSVSLTDGVHVLFVRVTDVAGNTASSATLTVTVDTVAPKLSLPPGLTAEAAGPWGAVVNYTASADDGGGLFRFETTPASGRTFRLGQTSVDVVAIDVAGNVANGAFAVIVQDTIPPDTSLVTHPPEVSNKNSAAFNFSGSDGGTALSDLVFQVSLDGNPFTTLGSNILHLTGLAEGDHTLLARCIDKAGNVDPVPIIFGWVIEQGVVSQTYQVTPTVRLESSGLTLTIHAEGLPPGCYASLMYEWDGWRELGAVELPADRGTASFTFTAIPQKANLFLSNRVTGASSGNLATLRFALDAGRWRLDVPSETFSVDGLSSTRSVTVPLSLLDPPDVPAPALEGLAWVHAVQQENLGQDPLPALLTPTFFVTGDAASVHFHGRNMPAGFLLALRPANTVDQDTLASKDVRAGDAETILEMPSVSGEVALVLLDKSTGQRVGPPLTMTLQDGRISQQPVGVRFALPDLAYRDGVYLSLLDRIDREQVLRLLADAGNVIENPAEVREWTDTLRLLDGEVYVSHSENGRQEIRLPWGPDRYQVSLDARLVPVTALTTAELIDGTLRLQIAEGFSGNPFTLTFTVTNGIHSRTKQATVEIIGTPDLVEQFEQSQDAWEAGLGELASARSRSRQAEDALAAARASEQTTAEELRVKEEELQQAVEELAAVSAAVRREQARMVALAEAVGKTVSGTEPERFWTRIETSGTASGLRVSTDGKTLLYSDGPMIRVADLRSGDVRRTFALHGQTTVWDFALSPSGALLASTSPDNTLRIADFATGILVRTVTFSSGVSSFAWQPREDSLIVSTGQGIFKVGLDGTKGLILPEHRGRVAFSPDGRFLIASRNRFLEFLDPQTLAVHHSIDFDIDKSSQDWVARTAHLWAVAPSGQQVIAAGTTPGGPFNDFNSYRIQDGNRTAHIDIGGWMGSMPTFSPDGQLLALISRHMDPNSRLEWCEVEFHRWEEGAWAKDPMVHRVDDLFPIALSPDGSALYIAKPGGIENLPTPRAEDAMARRELLPNWDDDPAGRAAIEAALGELQTRLAGKHELAGEPSVLTLVLHGNELVLQGSQLLDIRQNLDALGKEPLSLELFSLWEQTCAAWEARHEEFTLLSDRLRGLLQTMVDGTIGTADLDRYLRERKRSLDLWNFVGQSEWYGEAVGFNLGEEGQVRLVNVGSNQPVGLLSPEQGEHHLELPAMLTGIDASQLTHVATGFRLRLQVFGTAPTVSVFRSGINIANVSPGSDGVVEFTDPQGFTDLLIRRAGDSTLILQGVAFITDPQLAASESLPLSPATNRDIALAVAPASWNEVGGSSIEQIEVDPNKYTRVRVTGYTKNVEIADIRYNIPNYETAPLPDGFITRIDSHTWIVHPGTPSTLIAKTRGGTVWFLGESRGYEWEYEREVRSADTLQALVPTGPMSIELNTMQAYTPVSETPDRFLDLRPSEIRDRGWPVGGGAVAFVLEMRNTGGVGGSVTLELFGLPSNYDPNNLGSPQKTFYTSFEQGGVRMLQSSVSVEAGPDDRGMVVARLTLPDGSVKVVPFLGTRPHREVSTIYRTWNPETHQIDGFYFQNPYSSEEETRIARTQIRLAQAFWEQGNLEEANRIIAGISRAIQAGGPAPGVQVWVDPDFTGEPLEYVPPPDQNPNAGQTQVLAPGMAELLQDVNRWLEMLPQLQGSGARGGVLSPHPANGTLIVSARVVDGIDAIPTGIIYHPAPTIDENLVLTPGEPHPDLSTLKAIGLQVREMDMEAVRGELLALYNDDDLHSYPILEYEYVRDDTVAGRVLHGLWQQWKTTFQDHLAFQWSLAKAERLLGVRAAYLWIRARDHNFETFRSALVSEFKKQGYGHLFLGRDPEKQHATTSRNSEIANFATLGGRFEYDEHDQKIVIRFDLTIPKGSASKWYRQGAVYLIDAISGEQVPVRQQDGSDRPVKVNFRDDMAIEIPLSSLLPFSASTTSFTGLVRFKLALWDTDNIVGIKGMQGRNVSNTILVNASTGLRQMSSATFDEWMNQLGTIMQDFDDPVSYMNGRNIHGGYDIANELDTPIHAYIGGTITSVSGSSSDVDGWGLTVVITDSNGNQHRYAHLNQLAPRFEVGALVSSGDVFAYMGNSGFVIASPGEDGTHLHYEVKDAQCNLLDPRQ